MIWFELGRQWVIPQSDGNDRIVGAYFVFREISDLHACFRKSDSVIVSSGGTGNEAMEGVGPIAHQCLVRQRSSVVAGRGACLCVGVSRLPYVHAITWTTRSQ
jgi:hypothetical protein